MNFSMFSCSHFLSMGKPNTMSKRAQERRTGEEPVVAQSRPVRLISRRKFSERKSISHVGFGYIIQPGELQIGLEFRSHKR